MIKKATRNGCNTLKAADFGLVVAGGVMLVTAPIGFCGLYSLLGIRTSQTKEQL
ncbi:DUF2892 domain-containing protein [Kamptonema animale]|uniref:YgaP family membrane protein n=1 Tax=Kamptonema animale TaxID=92934 RepID=UPI003A92F049